MKISHHFFLKDRIIAPVEEGQKLGDLEYRLGSVTLGKVTLIAEFGVEKAGFFANFANTLFN